MKHNEQDYRAVSTSAKKLILKRHNLGTALQFTVDDSIQPIVTLGYPSSDEEMEVDDPSQASVGENDQESDIEVLRVHRQALFAQSAT